MICTAFYCNAISWEEFVRRNKLDKWAYLDDLIPEEK